MRNLDPRSLGICLQCGYDITGVTAQNCPECGAAIEPFVAWTRSRILMMALIALAPGSLISAVLWALPPSARGFGLRPPSISSPFGLWPTFVAVLGPNALYVLHLFVCVFFASRLASPRVFHGLKGSRLVRQLRRRLRATAWRRQLILCMFVIIWSASAVDWLAVLMWFRVALGRGGGP